MTAADWKILTEDLQAGKGALMALIEYKLSFWNRLPWLLICLAHTDDEIARNIGREALEQFEVDPR